MRFLIDHVVLSNSKKNKTFITGKYKLSNLMKLTNSLYSYNLITKKPLIKIKALAKEGNSTRQKFFINNCYAINEKFFCLKTSYLKPLPLFGLIYSLSIIFKNNVHSKTIFKLVDQVELGQPGVCEASSFSPFMLSGGASHNNGEKPKPPSESKNQKPLVGLGTPSVAFGCGAAAFGKKLPTKFVQPSLALIGMAMPSKARLGCTNFVCNTGNLNNNFRRLTKVKFSLWWRSIPFGFWCEAKPSSMVKTYAAHQRVKTPSKKSGVISGGSARGNVRVCFSLWGADGVPRPTKGWPSYLSCAKVIPPESPEPPQSPSLFRRSLRSPLGRSINQRVNAPPPNASHPKATEIFQKNKIIKINYSLESFHRSNQDTILLHKPSVFEGQWIESGDLLADCSTSVGGDLSLGQNILIGYMPWEGYNFEDAILVSERLVYDDLYTSIHIEKYEIEIKQTELGMEELTREIPEIEETEIKHLDKIGIAKLGTWIEEGDILVGKITPIKKKEESPYKKLLYTILERQFIPFRDSSLRAPKGAKAKVIDIKFFKNQNFILNKKKKEKISKLSNKHNFFQNPTKIISKKKNLIKNKTIKTNLKQLVFNRRKKNNSSFQKTIFSRLKFLKLQKKKSKPFFNKKGLDINKNKIKKFNYLKNSVINEMTKTNLIIEFSNSLIVTKKKQIKLNLAKIYSKKKNLYFLVKTSNKLKINSQNKFNITTNKIKFELIKNKKKKKIGWKFSHKKKLTMHKNLSFQSSLIISPTFWGSGFSFGEAYLSAAKGCSYEVCFSEALPLTFSMVFLPFGFYQRVCFATKGKTKIKKVNKNLYFKTKKLPSFYLTIKRNDFKKNLLASYFFARRKTYKKLFFKKQNIISQKSDQHYKRQRLFFFKNKIKNKKIIKSFKGSISSIHIYLAEKRKIQIGDKMSGRHGNKGIVSQILPREDMPYLPDGTPLDMVLNPLGVPSRMNVGQIYECLLGLAGKYLGEKFQILPFDEIYGPEASRSFVYSKLYEARIKTGMNWLYDPNNPGKMKLYDGRTGDCFDQTITVGQSYILRLVHMVDDKIHARSIGPYSLVTQQPLRGRSKRGGQRLGEMEVWALEGYGAAFTLLEMLTIKSDDMTGRITLWSKLLLEKDLSIGTPESFKVLLCELQALCLDIGLFRPNPLKNYHLEKIETLISLR